MLNDFIRYFATLLDALEKDQITRLILVGDPNQLPPIGPGRPFADIIKWLKNNAPQCVAKLNTCMRTISDNEDSISTGLNWRIAIAQIVIILMMTSC